MNTRHRDTAARWRLTEGTRANFLAEAILATNTEVNAISARDLLVGHLVRVVRLLGKRVSEVGDLEMGTQA